MLGSVEQSGRVALGYLLWARAICSGRQDAVTPTVAASGPDTAALASCGDERKAKELLLKADSLPMILGELEGSGRSETGLSTWAEGREGEPGESSGCWKDGDNSSLSYSTGQERRQ